jgi:hypothetical protein
MPYVYFDWSGYPARVLFEGAAVIRSEVWNPFSRKLTADETGTFTYGLLHIDPTDGLVDDEYVISKQEFDVLVEKRRWEAPPPFSRLQL